MIDFTKTLITRSTERLSMTPSESKKTWSNAPLYRMELIDNNHNQEAGRTIKHPNCLTAFQRARRSLTLRSLTYRKREKSLSIVRSIPKQTTSHKFWQRDKTWTTTTKISFVKGSISMLRQRASISKVWNHSKITWNWETAHSSQSLLRISRLWVEKDQEQQETSLTRDFTISMKSFKESVLRKKMKLANS